MSNNKELKPLSIAVGAALAASTFTMTAANAEENPFEINSLTSGYMVADAHKEGGCGEGKCGEGKCGEGKGKAEGSCGEGKCGEGKSCKMHKQKMMKKMDADGDGAISKEEFMNFKEKRFSEKDANGDGVLTEDEMKKHKEGKCGEGKCGEGKCGEKN